jgi:hypothetical protein
MGGARLRGRADRVHIEELTGLKMRFLRRLFSPLVNCLETLRQHSRIGKDHPRIATPRELPPGELVARFIYSKNHMTARNSRPKPGAFDPSPHSVLSVVHSTGLSDAEVWGIGRLTLSDSPGRERIHGRADIPTSSFIEKGLRTVRDDIGFQRHVSVTGWPQMADADERKQRRKEICLQLSLDAAIKLVVPASPVSKS